MNSSHRDSANGSVPIRSIVRAGVATIGYLAVLFAVYYFHVHFLTVDVVFYSALVDVVVASVAAFALLWLLGWARQFNHLELTQLVLIWLLLGYSLAISVPTVIDRSLSFYILEKLDQRGGGIKLDRFEEVFTREYAKEHRLVDVRLTEQIASGTVRIENGCVRLTDRGSRLVTFSRAFRTNFLPRNRLLMGEYTDDLTDPFRSSHDAPDYGCDGQTAPIEGPRQ